MLIEIIVAVYPLPELWDSQYYNEAPVVRYQLDRYPDGMDNNLRYEVERQKRRIDRIEDKVERDQ